MHNCLLGLFGGTLIFLTVSNSLMADELTAMAVNFEEKVVYYPQERPGYVGWVSLFLFGNGELGMAFDEVRRVPNPRFIPPSIEYLEAISFVYRYSQGGAPAAHPKLLHEAVYMKSSDGGRTWQVTGRDWGKTSYTTGYPDGRMIRMPGGYQQSAFYERGADRLYTSVEESRDGGKTWKQIARLLDGYMFSVFRVKKLRDSSLIAIGPITPISGPGGSRSVRGMRYPGERSLVQAALMHSPDGGYTWTGPHYVLQGVPAWEPDFVELRDGRLLVINSSVQRGAQTRQFVHRVNAGFVCDPVTNIEGMGADAHNVQSGIVPETVDITSEGLIIGTRRGGMYSCSNDLGQTWHLIAGAPKSNYQPQGVSLPDGRFLNAWHLGTDSVFGQQDMCIGLHSFRLQANLPAPTQLTLVRSLSADGSQYVNTHRARLTGGGNPISGKTIELRVKHTWNSDGTHNATPIDKVKDVRTAITDENGVADFLLSEYDLLPDLYFSYVVQATFTPEPNDNMTAGKSAMYDARAMTAKRNSPHAYHIYCAENTLFISGPTAEEYPELKELTERIDDFNEDLTMGQLVDSLGGQKRGRQIVDFLIANNILDQVSDGKYRWYRTVHCGPKVIEHVRVNDLEDYAI